MILPFTLTINNKPTYFVEKIWKSIKDHEITQELVNPTFSNYFDWSIFGNVEPKLHTIRPDTTNRWHEGNKIHFYINCRQKNMFQFAPVLKVVSIQDVFMTYGYNDLIQISIDGTELFGFKEREQFAMNDGFDTWQDFFDYFYPVIMSNPKKEFTGKLIHWTDKRY